jgi:hypothetical protein
MTSQRERGTLGLDVQIVDARERGVGRVRLRVGGDRHAAEAVTGVGPSEVGNASDRRQTATEFSAPDDIKKPSGS